ncbi:uncharacterized protein BDR25DRAFT_378014 [Lindgomyces ingoldianus]|uniref:Uncharacterized protein n=1 Tax=Lindgomyces ingoldianus TaxID=673940 RepID=A0ACB6QFU3_9PLEO|nr:uncharacterized protein BDR25DRAFT_378014 [Lindgomyces ingoldianus]KAF2465859.1 hypothetical protein BDR25DRAFT_378014 [Lindgomyces ingoldianus]
MANASLSNPDMELRERNVARRTDGLSSLHLTDDIHSLRPVSNEDAIHNKLPALKFMPLMLRTASLCSGLVFNLIVLGLLIALLFYNEFSFSSQWGYLSIQILPPVLGTITASLWHGISVNLSRMTPFMLAAAPSGSTFRKTILGSYFPGLSLGNAITTGNGLLAFIWILEILSSTILSFKSSLLNTADYDTYVVAVVTSWALYSLIAIYGLMILLNVSLIYKLYNQITGLRWDTISIADHLVLFRHSNFLDDLEGTDTAERESIWMRLRDDRLKLGYWFRGEDIWHGFGKLPKVVQKPKNNDALPEQRTSNQDEHPPTNPQQSPEHACQKHKIKNFSMKDIVATRYRSVALNMEHFMAYIWVTITLTLMAAFITGLALDMVDGIDTSISYNWAIIIFQFIPTFIVSFHTWFWQDVDLFTRTTQPFRGMYKPRQASENLLLDYICLPPFAVTYMAIKNGHIRVAWTSVIAIIQRLLPILMAGSITVISEHESGSTIYASKPLSICVIIWLFLYIILIPLEIFGWRLPRRYVKRHLPRYYSSISDLVSWSYASKLLRDDNDNAFDIPVKGPKNQQWYMEAQLRLRQNEDGSDFATYGFGLYKSTEHDGVSCMGFDDASNVTLVPCPSLKKSGTVEEAEAEQEKVAMLAPEDLKHILDASKERWTNLKTIEQHPPHQEEEAA